MNRKAGLQACGFHLVLAPVWSIRLLGKCPIRLLRKCCDVADQFRRLFVGGPDVAAQATEIVDVTGVAHGQKLHPIIAARWTLQGYCHGSSRGRIRGRMPP